MTDLNRLKNIIGENFKGFYIEPNAIRDGYGLLEILVVWTNKETSLDVCNIVGRHAPGKNKWLKTCKKIPLDEVMLSYSYAFIRVMKEYAKGDYNTNDNVKYFLNKI